MRKITTKLSNLHKLFKVEEYEKEFELNEDIFIEALDGEYVRINYLVKKKTPMIRCSIEGIDDSYICAEKHIIMTPEGWKFMIDSDVVLDKNGKEHRVNSKESAGIQDSYDVSIDNPHTYVTSNGLVHHNTFLAMYRAIEEVLSKDNPFKQVVVVRSTVAVRDMGFLPGSVDEKIDVYEQPYKEICQTLFGRPDAWTRLKEQGYARFIPSSFIRGISIDDAIIIVDECQSMTWHELSSIIGRVGYRSKIIFAGDKFQNDLVKNKNDVSGLEEFLDVVKTMREFEAIYFTPDDIVRSSLVKSFIEACAAKGKLPNH